MASVRNASHATAAARELAEAHGLDLRAYVGLGIGPNGRITEEDVRGWLRLPRR